MAYDPPTHSVYPSEFTLPVGETAPIAVAEEFFPGETRARQFNNADDHRLYQAPALITNSIFSMAIRLKGTIAAWVSGHIIDQLLNDGTLTGGFIVNAGQFTTITAVDTAGTDAAKKLDTQANGFPAGINQGDWYTMYVSADPLNSGGATINFGHNGVDCVNDVGYFKKDVKAGGGLDAFDADESGETTLGNYQRGSTFNLGLTGIVGKIDIWDGVFLSESQWSEHYSDQQSLLGISEDEKRRNFFCRGRR